MFGARNDEGWRLCYRKGKSIIFVCEKKFPDIIVEFPSQARAKACADELNEDWKQYQKEYEKPGALFWKFIDILVFHNGISADDRKLLEAG